MLQLFSSKIFFILLSNYVPQRYLSVILCYRYVSKKCFIFYTIGMFLNGRKEKVERQRMTEPAVQKVWKQRKNNDEYEGESLLLYIILLVD